MGRLCILRLGDCAVISTMRQPRPPARAQVPEAGVCIYPHPVKFRIVGLGGGGGLRSTHVVGWDPLRGRSAAAISRFLQGRRPRGAPGNRGVVAAGWGVGRMTSRDSSTATLSDPT